MCNEGVIKEKVQEVAGTHNSALTDGAGAQYTVSQCGSESTISCFSWPNKNLYISLSFPPLRVGSFYLLHIGVSAINIFSLLFIHKEEFDNI
jgi:hypothetical protein